MFYLSALHGNLEIDILQALKTENPGGRNSNVNKILEPCNSSYICSMQGNMMFNMKKKLENPSGYKQQCRDKPMEDKITLATI